MNNAALKLPAFKAKATQEAEDKRAGLPQEVLDQLTKKRSLGAVSAMVVEAVEASKEPVSIDDIIISIYKKYGEIVQRKALSMTLLNLIRHKKIAKPVGENERSGIYCSFASLTPKD